MVTAGRRANGRRRAPVGPAGAIWLRCSSPSRRRIPAGSAWAPPLASARPARVVAEPAQSLVVVGPTQSGKTSALAVPAILGWEGPVLAASVKSDLLRHTQGRTGRTGPGLVHRSHRVDRGAASAWTPLAACADWSGARRMAADLAETAKTDGTTADGEFWYATAAKLLAPLLLRRRLGGRTMADVVRWVDTQEVGRGGRHPRAGRGARGAGRGPGLVVPRRTDAELGVHHGRDRPGPVCRAAVGVRPSRCVRAGRPPRGIAHRCTSCAPAHDQRRLRGYFTALTQQVLSHAFARATRSGRPLDPPLLVVLDEAAHIAPLAELDGLAATCASHGIQLVTVWQDLAQVRARYGARAPTVSNNHRAKVFLPGIADPDTLEYASRLIGDEEVTLPSLTRDPGRALHHPEPRAPPAAPARGPALPAPRRRGAGLRHAAAGPAAAPAVVVRTRLGSPGTGSRPPCTSRIGPTSWCTLGRRPSRRTGPA